MKLISKKIVLIPIFLFVLFSFAQVSAQNDYTLLAPLPCVGGGSCDQVATETQLPTYINGLIKLVIGLSAVFAVLMIIIGGFQYMTSDALQGKQDGKNRIKNAFWGLLLVGASFIILNTINPNLLEINLNIDKIQTGSQNITSGGTLSVSGQAGVAMTAEQIAESNRVKELIEDTAKGVVVYAGPCTQGQPTGCVNMNGLTPATIDNVIALHKFCSDGKGSPCSMIITGGTEPGAHSIGSVHYVGRALDFRPTADFTNQIKAKATYLGTDNYGERYTLQMGGVRVNLLFESKGNGHWHVTFN